MTNPIRDNSSVWPLAESMGFGEVHFKFDPRTNLRAIIAIHSTALGPALGGCRFVHYDSVDAAAYDAIRLAQGMSHKAAISGLSLGGGKSVIMRPAGTFDRDAIFGAFGEFVDSLGGRYITAVDSGTSVSDMDTISQRTRHVASTSATGIATGDPSPYTAYGVLRGIEAAVKFKLRSETLHGLTVAIQGVGHVGYPLAKLLHEHGAQLIVTDHNPDNLARVEGECAARVVDADNIYSAECDVFAPCALGAIVNAQTVPRLKAQIIAGAANNQLSEPQIGEQLRQRDILYAPDYVINAGGLIQIAMREDKATYAKLDEIYTTLLDIFQAAAKQGKTTAAVADERAREIIANASR